MTKKSLRIANIFAGKIYLLWRIKKKNFNMNFFKFLLFLIKKNNQFITLSSQNEFTKIFINPKFNISIPTLTYLNMWYREISKLQTHLTILYVSI